MYSENTISDPPTRVEPRDNLPQFSSFSHFIQVTIPLVIATISVGFGYLGYCIQRAPTHIHHQFIRIIHEVNNTTKQGRDELGIVCFRLLTEGVQERHWGLVWENKPVNNNYRECINISTYALFITIKKFCRYLKSFWFCSESSHCFI